MGIWAGHFGWYQVGRKRPRTTKPMQKRRNRSHHSQSEPHTHRITRPINPNPSSASLEQPWRKISKLSTHPHNICELLTNPQYLFFLTQTHYLSSHKRLSLSLLYYTWFRYSFNLHFQLIVSLFFVFFWKNFDYFLFLSLELIFKVWRYRNLSCQNFFFLNVFVEFFLHSRG